MVQSSKQEGIYRRIVDAIQAQGHEARLVINEDSYDEIRPEYEVGIDGILLGYCLSVDRKHKKYLHSPPTKEFNVVITSMMDKVRTKHWPERKDGTHNYDAIALYAILLTNIKREQKERNAIRVRNQQHLTPNFVRELGLTELDPISIMASDDEKRPVRVYIAFEGNMTFSDTKALVTALRLSTLLEKKEAEE